jgi:uncharacterized membrane protein
MEANPPEPLVDARSVRFELAAMAVLLLGGYVFGILWVIPALAVLLAVGIGFGARANLFNQLFQALIAARLKPSTATESAILVRFSEVFAVAMLTVATLLFAIGLSGLAWVIALIEAGICALHATTGLSVEAAVRARLFERGRR